MRNRSLLLAGATLVALAAGAGGAGAATLPAGTTAILSGDAALLGALPTPVGETTIAAQAASQDGTRVAFSSRSGGLSGEGILTSFSMLTTCSSTLFFPNFRWVRIGSATCSPMVNNGSIDVIGS